MAIRKVKINEKPGDVASWVTARLDGMKFGDFGKPVKLTGAAQYAVCADGDPIQGFARAFEDYTDEGKMVGSVQRHAGGMGGFKEAMIAASGWAIGNHVVAAAQATSGTYNDAQQFHRPKVKLTAVVSDVIAAAGDRDPRTPYNWRIVDVVVGTVGSANAVVVLEAV